MLGANGCVSKGRYQGEVTSLQNQIAQMDTTIKAQEAELASLRKPPQAQVISGTFAGATYRTPSGLELPAMDIQKALKHAGYFAGAIDGKIGPDSREAIRSFQRDNGLTSDGVCGRQTWNKLKTHLA
jgi:murein L,D-transpeptidase YcbB/YkuD